jgi:hypothetical protein
MSGYAFESKRILRQEDQLNDGLKNTDDLINILEGCTLLRIGALVTVVADASMTITVTQRILTGSDASAVAVDTIVVPDTTAVGKIVFTDVTPQALNAGDQLKFAIANTGSASAFQIFAVVSPNEQAHENETDMVESA